MRKRSHFRARKPAKMVNAAYTARLGLRSWVKRAIWLTGRNAEYTVNSDGMMWPKAGSKRKLAASDIKAHEDANNYRNAKLARRRAAWTGAVA
jgi:hypothetical protein